MNERLETLFDRMRALPQSQQESLVSLLNARLSAIEASEGAKKHALLHDLQIGIDQLDGGEGIPAKEVFAELDR